MGVDLGRQKIRGAKKKERPRRALQGGAGAPKKLADLARERVKLREQRGQEIDQRRVARAFGSSHAL